MIRAAIIMIVMFVSTYGNETDSIKAEYKKRFGKPITDFEYSIDSVFFQSDGREDISISKTANGAIAKSN